MHLNSEFDTARCSIAGSKQVSPHHTFDYLRAETYLSLYQLIHKVKKVKILH